MTLALPFPATGYAPSPAGLTLYAVEASALPTDEALMLAWAGGDLHAFESLYARHRKRLFGFLLRQLRDNALAEEIFQDVWQRVISARAGWQPEAAFSTWLFRIAHNRLNDHWRAARHRPAAPGRRSAPGRDRGRADPGSRTFRIRTTSPHPAGDGAIAARAARSAATAAGSELSLEEIGQITGVGRETVKSRLRYAMDKLRAGLNA